MSILIKFGGDFFPHIEQVNAETDSNSLEWDILQGILDIHMVKVGSGQIS